MGLQAAQNAPALGASVGSGGSVRGVLFDIDDTLVDLHAAMKVAMIAASKHLLPAFTQGQWDGFAGLYMADAGKYYDRYIAGEFTFSQQRGLRARAVFTHLGIDGFDQAAETVWIEDFEKAQPAAISAYPDVVPVLDALDAIGIPYGAVSNNVHDYQRAKLDHAGLSRVKVLVGIDTLNAAKPEPQVFWEGCRLLGTAPAQTLYVGDNYVIDGVGSAQAGLKGLWLNRKGASTPPTAAADRVLMVSGLMELLSVLQEPAVALNG